MGEIPFQNDFIPHLVINGYTILPLFLAGADFCYYIKRHPFPKYSKSQDLYLHKDGQEKFMKGRFRNVLPRFVFPLTKSLSLRDSQKFGVLQLPSHSFFKLSHNSSFAMAAITGGITTLPIP